MSWKPHYHAMFSRLRAQELNCWCCWVAARYLDSLGRYQTATDLASSQVPGLPTFRGTWQICVFFAVNLNQHVELYYIVLHPVIHAAPNTSRDQLCSMAGPKASPSRHACHKSALVRRGNLRGRFVSTLNQEGFSLMICLVVPCRHGNGSYSFVQLYFHFLWEVCSSAVVAVKVTPYEPEV